MISDYLGIPRTAIDVFNMLPEDTACEVIDDALYFREPPTLAFQEIYKRIAFELKEYVDENKCGTVLIRCDVYLDGGEAIVLPDIIFISNAREEIVARKGIMGAPNTIIEILSFSKIKALRSKLKLYQRNAISEYHIIDPETKEVWSYSLGDGKYIRRDSQKGLLFISQLDLTIAF